MDSVLLLGDETLLNTDILLDRLSVDISPCKFTIAKRIFEIYAARFVPNNPMPVDGKRVGKIVASKDDDCLSDSSHLGEVNIRWTFPVPIIAVVLLLFRTRPKTAYSFIGTL
jgi:hypothetical protein